MLQGWKRKTSVIWWCISIVLTTGTVWAGPAVDIPGEVFYYRPVAAVWDQSAIWNNPAALAGLMPGSAIIFTSRDDRLFRDWGMVGTWKFFGAAYRKIESDPQTREYIFGGGFGKKLKMGATYRYFKDGPGYLDNRHLWTIGVLSQYNKRFSLGARLENLNRGRINGERSEVRLVYGIGGRIYRDIVTATFDVDMTSGESHRQADFRTGVEVRPRRGLFLFADFDNHSQFNFGFRINLSREYVSHYHNFDRNFKGQQSTTAIGNVRGRQSSLVTVKKKSLVINLDGDLPENPEIPLWGKEPLKFYDFVSGINQAASDVEVTDIFLNIGYLRCGLAKVEELASALRHFRSRGKKVTAYLGGPTNLGYLLASEADRVIMPPVSELALVGLRAELKTYKGLLDKLGVEAELERVAEYKSMPEMFVMEQPSEEFRDQTNRILDGLFEQFVTTIAQNRFLPVDSVKTLIDNAPLTVDVACEAGLIDEHMYLDQARKKPEAGGFVSGKQTRFDDYVQETEWRDWWGEPPQLAVVVADGSITGNTAQARIGDRDIISALRQAAKDSDIKGVLLRINSSGGAALASDIIWHEIARLAENKPLVISMGNSAASGGYYITTVQSPIYADRATITGSIGVFAGKINLSDLYDKIGIHSELHVRGENAGYYDFSHPYTPQQREKLRDHLRLLYNHFVDRVAESRPMEADSVDILGRGRTWTGAEALANGLVDHVGGLNDALDHLRRECGLTAEESVTVVLPRKTYLFENPFDFSELFDKIINTVLGTNEMILSSEFFDETEYIFYRMPYNIEIK